MKLKIFNKESAGSGRIQSTVRSINVNRKNGRVVISAALRQSLDIKGGDRLMFAKDEESKNDWYLCITHDEAGYSIYEKPGGKNGRYATHSLYATCKMAAAELLDAIKADRAASLLVAAKPTQIDGTDWYQIITTKPLRITK